MAVFTALAIASAVSAGVSAVGQIRAGNAQKQAGKDAQAAADSAAGIDDYNAHVADLQAQDATDRGTLEEQKYRASVRGMIGSQRAAFAANNVDVGFGSAQDVQADSAFLGELDALQIRTNASREAWGYKVQGEDFRKKADVTRKEGVNAAAAAGQAATGSYFQAGGTLLSTGTSLLQARYGFK